jgi:glycerophosphoryl diester phosphodiesterase
MPVNFSSTASTPEVHGHRGCRGLRPENTLPAFLYALELGVDVLELDVIISQDNQVVVSHEPWLAAHTCLDAQGKRIPPAEEKQHNLYQLPYAAIRQSDCGLLKHPDFPEQQPVPAYKPLLREVLAIVEAQAQKLGRPPISYSVEIKSSANDDGLFQPAPARFLELVMAELRAAQLLARTTLLSFDVRILRLAHQYHPAQPCCLLVEDKIPWVDSVRALGFVPTVFGPDFTTASGSAVQQLRAAYPQLRLVPWTVNEPADMKRLYQWGVDGITTDYPDRLLQLLSR